MLLLAAAAMASMPTTNAPNSSTAAPVVQARATVRIVSGVSLKLGESNSAAGQRLRITTIATPQGAQPAKLVEFE